MAYFDKKPPSGSTTPLREGASLLQIKSYTEENYSEICTPLNAGGLEDINFHPAAGIHESKLWGAVDAHPHRGTTNLGEHVVGDPQLQWFGANTEGNQGVYLIRTFRPGMKILWGLTQPVVGRADNSLTYGHPKNVVMRVDFVSYRGHACPFSPGAVVQVKATPHVPPGTNDGTNEYFSGMEHLILGVDSAGFDLWVCLENVQGFPYLFSYVAMGWEVV